MVSTMTLLYVVVGIVIAFVGTLFARKLGKGSVTVQQAPSCRTCVHWDQAEGQAELRAHPIFANAVAPHVSPARMMQRFTPEGVLLPQAVKVKASEDNWTMYGKCNVDSDKDVCTHCAYKCDKFATKG